MGIKYFITRTSTAETERVTVNSAMKRTISDDNRPAQLMCIQLNTNSLYLNACKIKKIVFYSRGPSEFCSV